MALQPLLLSRFRGRLYILLIFSVALFAAYQISSLTFRVSDSNGSLSNLFEKKVAIRLQNLSLNKISTKENQKVLDYEVRAATETKPVSVNEIKNEDPNLNQMVKAKLNEKIPVNWSKKNLKLSPDVSNWWFKLLHHAPEDPTPLLESLYKAGSPDVDPRSQLPPGEKLYNTCAVVGSSDVILNTGEGEVCNYMA